MSRRTLFVAGILLAASLSSARAQDFFSPKGPRDRVRVDQRLNAQLPLDTIFRDENGKAVRLGDFFDGKRPVILNLVYYRCPMLCPVGTAALVDSISNIKFDLGSEYQIVTVSFDPTDTPKEATEKKRMYVKRYGREGAGDGWHFLTGSQQSITELVDAVGFRYFWDEQKKQFAHGSSLVVLTPGGRVARYIYGIEFPARDLRLALVEATDNRIATPTDQFLLLCYHYDPATGRYSRVAMNVVRAGGVATVLGLGGFVFLMIRRDRQTLKS
jgi:protein SCO1/2